ncbi:MAG: shikimate dehydrogenase [Chloroflexi bacterium]|nr:shikimate dehydrogenase [Chloroflexota bacterium]
MTNSSTPLVGLIGWPIEHSVSPAMHNAAFHALGLPWHYTLLPPPPQQIKETLTKLREEGYRGANVTVPHKQAVMPYLDKVTDTALAIGAVNTIVVQGRQLIGDNTDGDGFLAALQEVGFVPANSRALILGAGGAARAVVYALAQNGCAVTVYNRTVARAAKLAQHMECIGVRAPVNWMPMQATLANLDLTCFDLLVNATSVGMWPQVDASPWPKTLPLPSHWIVFDLVYNPPQTALLAHAQSSGARTIGGLGMLVRQGALAFALWTGVFPPIEVMSAAAEKALQMHRQAHG